MGIKRKYWIKWKARKCTTLISRIATGVAVYVAMFFLGEEFLSIPLTVRTAYLNKGTSSDLLYKRIERKRFSGSCHCITLASAILLIFLLNLVVASVALSMTRNA